MHRLSIIAALVVLGTPSLAADHVGGVAYLSCRDFLGAVRGRSDDPPILGSVQNWVFGYVSAEMDRETAPAFDSVTPDMVSDWLANDCRHNPDFTIRKVARRFVL